jgi:hypothetical protein
MFPLTAACVGEPESDLFASESNATEASEPQEWMSKKLHPPIAVPKIPVIGASMDKTVASLTIGYTLVSVEIVESMVDGISVPRTVQRWVRKGPGGSTRYTRYKQQTVKLPSGQLYQGHDILEYGLHALVWEDRNLDGKIDVHWDFQANPDREYYDRNSDGKVDFLIEHVSTVKNVVIEGYPAGWRPPVQPELRTFEDKDFDGYFDTEAIKGPGGGIYGMWRKR